MSQKLECRICYEDETKVKKMIQPCNCNGTNKYVHRKCLNQWRLYNPNNDAYDRCMLCKATYTFTLKYAKEKYTIHVFPSNGADLIFTFFLVNISLIIISILFGLIDNYLNNAIICLYLHYQNIYQLDNLFDQPSDNYLVLYMLYFSFVTFVITCILHIISSGMIYYNVQRKGKYFLITFLSHVSKVGASVHFIWLTHCIQLFTPYFFIFITSMLSFTNVFVFLSIFDNHNHKLKLLNKELNEKIIKNLDKNDDNIIP